MTEGHQQKLSIPILANELKDVNAHWFQLGVHLKISHSSLQKIEADYGHSGVDRCMTEMLALWLKASSTSWNKLATALNNMDMRALALRLRRTYVAPSTSTACSQPKGRAWRQDYLSVAEKANIPTKHLSCKDITVLYECELPNQIELRETYRQKRNVKHVQPIPGTDDLLNPSTKRGQQSVAQYLEVNSEDENLQKEYMQFLLKVGDLLEQRNVSTSNLLFAWSIRTDTTNPPSSLCEANSVQSLFRTLVSQHYSKYFDYHVIADLAEEFGREEGTMLVESYENNLRGQLRNRIKRKINTKASKLVVKVNWEKNHHRSKQDLAVSFRSTLSKLFGQRPEEYVLKSVRDGCLELTFLIPEAGIPHLKGIVHRNSDCLKQLRVIALTIDEELLWEQPDDRDQAELDDLPSPSKKLRLEFDVQVLSNVDRSTTDVIPPRDTDQRRRISTGPFRGMSGPFEPTTPHSTYPVWIPALIGLVVIVVGVILLVIAGMKQNEYSSATFLLGGLLLLVVGFLCCSLVPRWRHNRRCRFIRYSLLAVILFAVVLYWHYQHTVL